MGLTGPLVSITHLRTHAMLEYHWSWKQGKRGGFPSEEALDDTGGDTESVILGGERKEKIQQASFTEDPLEKCRGQ